MRYNCKYKAKACCGECGGASGIFFSQRGAHCFEGKAGLRQGEQLEELQFAPVDVARVVALDREPVTLAIRACPRAADISSSVNA